MQLFLFKYNIMCKTIFKALFVAFLFLNVYSCDFGPKPDKVIKMVVELDKSERSNDEINIVVETLKKRIGKISRNFSVKKIANSNQIEINIETHHEAERVKNLVINQGKLDFYETYQVEDMMRFIMDVNDILKKNEGSENPLFDLVKRQGYQGGPILFNVSEKDTASVNSYISLKAAESSLPAQRRFVKFLWGRKEKGTEELPLYALKLNKQAKPALTGKVVNQARQEFDQLSRPTITMVMNEEGAKVWEDLTGKAFEERFQIAMVINDIVYSAPGVSYGPIVGGRSEISGDFTVEEAQDFANILESGRIPKINIITMAIEKLK